MAGGKIIQALGRCNHQDVEGLEGDAGGPPQPGGIAVTVALMRPGARRSVDSPSRKMPMAARHLGRRRWVSAGAPPSERPTGDHQDALRPRWITGLMGPARIDPSPKYSRLMRTAGNTKGMALEAIR